MQFIQLTDENGDKFYLNAAKIEAIEQNAGGSEITIDGTRLIYVEESPEQVIELCKTA